MNCSFQQTSLTEQTGKIDYLATLYKSYASSAENGGRVSNTTLSDWVDQVLAQGQYTSQSPIGQILITMANLLAQSQTGAVRACIASLVPPEDDTFDDYTYYNKVTQFTNYYYQALGLMLLNESYHYKACHAGGREFESRPDRSQSHRGAITFVALFLLVVTILITVLKIGKIGAILLGYW